ncbi:hypothetical protein AMTR_s00004p00066620 [Amborella trichopoda]|uniref:Uncharacterized protein n=1 Tax=Amborella trichopoda TaxID=13333 RepID=W1NDV5_AMBTC|nr:hypothetical protein AMTR_s00004p00066620 [Amborella trichopoda]
MTHSGWCHPIQRLWSMENLQAHKLQNWLGLDPNPVRWLFTRWLGPCRVGYWKWRWIGQPYLALWFGLEKLVHGPTKCGVRAVERFWRHGHGHNHKRNDPHYV